VATNLPDTPFRWLPRAICREFAVSAETLLKRLTEAGQSPAQDGTYGTPQIIDTLFSGDQALRRRKLQEEGDKLALENQITRAEFLSRPELTRVFTALANAIKQIIANSNLSREDQDELQANLSNFEVVLDDVAKRQTRLRTEKQHERNGSTPVKGKKTADSKN
jgi:hypothetical protein